MGLAGFWASQGAFRVDSVPLFDLKKSPLFFQNFNIWSKQLRVRSHVVCTDSIAQFQQLLLTLKSLRDRASRVQRRDLRHNAVLGRRHSTSDYYRVSHSGRLVWKASNFWRVFVVQRSLNIVPGVLRGHQHRSRWFINKIKNVKLLVMFLFHFLGFLLNNLIVFSMYLLCLFVRNWCTQ